MPCECERLSEEIHSIHDEMMSLVSRIETLLAEGDNPSSAKCEKVMSEPIHCYDFSASRRYAACRAWNLMESENISWHEALRQAWLDAKQKCVWE